MYYPVVILRCWILALMMLATFLVLVVLGPPHNKLRYFNGWGISFNDYSPGETRQMCAQLLMDRNELSPVRSSINCDKIFAGNFLEVCRGRWTRNSPNLPALLHEMKHCEKFMFDRYYPLAAASQEEADFPIAYSIMVHRNFEQFERLLRLIYAPQNVYCIHVDPRNKKLVKIVGLLVSCLPNVMITSRNVPVIWAGYGVLRGTLNCLEDLTIQNKEWKYFINLSGMDFPLKTNAEIVKHVKSLNGSSDAEVKLETKEHRYKYHYEVALTRFKQPDRMVRTALHKSPPPENLVIYRGNLAATLSRPLRSVGKKPFEIFLKI